MRAERLPVFNGFFLRLAMITLLSYNRVSTIRSVTQFSDYRRVINWKLAHARAVLVRYGISVNDACNGVFLKSSLHRFLHTYKYYETVDKMIFQATSKEELISILSTIRTMLLNGTFPYK